MIEKQSGRYITILKSNRGGEYESDKFVEYCREQGISRQFTSRYTPKKNGVVERKNQTIMNMEKSMLKSKSLSNVEFWEEVVSYSVYILNRASSKSVKNKIPYEA